eukprot:gene3038-biopygen25855
MCHVERMPPEVMLKILSQLDGKTLVVAVPQVCKLWRALCQDIRNVHLDFSWCVTIPVEALAGLKQTAFVIRTRKNIERTERKLRRDSRGGGGGGAGNTAEVGWTTGMCELFPRTTSVTMNSSRVNDAHLMVLAGKCHGITHADFACCQNLTDAAVIALADECSGITHTDFHACENLTDAAVVALADKCPGITHADFGRCWNLTDAAVVALADKCPGITHAVFRRCWNLTDAAKNAVTAQRPNCKFQFY